MAKIIDGKAFAAELRLELSGQVAGLAREGVVPGLAVVLVGEDPASEVYVRSKVRQTAEVGMRSFEHRLSASSSEGELIDLISMLNADESVDGILVQLPLPPHVDSMRVLRSIDPRKDVDGFHPMNVGLLSVGAGGVVPCTPLGALLLLRSVHTSLAGLNAVIVGRSNIVGKPLAQLLLAENCTVTIAHSRSRGLPDIIRTADIVVAAVGRPEFVRGDWIKPGATVIDVGINRVEAKFGKSRLVGDVAFSEASAHVGAITPVPGGVGPMTIACLLRNTLAAARLRHG